MLTRGATGWSAVTSAIASKRVVPALPLPDSLTKKTRSMSGSVPKVERQSRPSGSR